MMETWVYQSEQKHKGLAMKFVLISGKCRNAKGELIEKGEVYEAASLKELIAKQPSLANKVEAVKGDAKLEVATPKSGKKK